MRLTLLGLAAVFMPRWAVADTDSLATVKARRAVEAQRIEKAFTDGRTAAYKLVRSANPNPVEAVEKIHDILALVRATDALSAAKKEQFIVTLKADIERLKETAAEKRRFARRELDIAVARDAREEARRYQEEKRGSGRKDRVADIESLVRSRAAAVADGRDHRNKSSERYTKLIRSVEESAVPDHRDIRFPKDWVERTKLRSNKNRMTAREKAILRALNTVIKVDYKGNTFEEVIESLEKLTGQSISVDKRSLDEVGATFESTIKLRLRATARSVLKRVLADLNLGYVIKNEQIQVMSLDQARQMTTTKAYYIGDLAAVADVRLGPVLTQAIMLENVRNIIDQIKANVDPQSWRENNPDAPGTIVFVPSQMAIVVKQTAEVHFMLNGLR
jgi:hypothetical protein